MLSSHFASLLSCTNVNTAFEINNANWFWVLLASQGWFSVAYKLTVSKPISWATFASALMLVGSLPPITLRLTREERVQHLNVFAQMKTSLQWCWRPPIYFWQILRALQSYERASFLFSAENKGWTKSSKPEAKVSFEIGTCSWYSVTKHSYGFGRSLIFVYEQRKPDGQEQMQNEVC